MLRSCSRFVVPSLVACVVAIGACSLTNLDGFTSGDGASSGDAATVMPPDGSGDGLGDSGGIVVSEDARADGAAKGFCNQQEAGFRICSDFDPPGGSVTDSFDRGLMPVLGGTGGTFDFDTSIFVSPTRAARGTANPFGAGGRTGLRLMTTLWGFGPSPSSLHCSLAWYPANLSTIANDYAHVVQVGVYSSADESQQIASLSFNMQGDGKLIFHEDYPNTAKNRDTSIPKTITTGQWIPIDIVITTSGIQLNVGGTLVTFPSLSVPIPATSHGALSIGPAYYGGSTTSPSPGWTFVYDDVVCW